MPQRTPADDPLDTVPMSDSLRALARRGEQRRYRKGTLLISEGDRGDTLFVILAGRLRAFSSSPDGAREVTYGVYLPGEYIGEMGLDGGPRSANVITLEASTLAMLTRPTLERHLQEDPRFAFELMAKIIWRARAATMGLRQIALNDVYGRLKALLEELAEPQTDGSRVVPGRLTHLEIAQRLGCTREMVSRVMKSLQVGDYVRADAGQLRLLRPLPEKW